MNQLSGEVAAVRFHNRDNGYSVFTLEIPKERSITCVGTMVAPSPGMKVKLFGCEAEHPKFGPQFQFESYTTEIPNDAGAFAEFLHAQVDGLHKREIQKMMKECSVETVSDSLSDELFVVQYVPAERVQRVVESWNERKHLSAALMELTALGIAPGVGAKIARAWGVETISKIQTNPYDMTHIYGIGFKTADAIARNNLNVAASDPRRLSALVAYTLENAGNDGHCYLYLDDLLERMESEAGVHRDHIDIDRYIYKNPDVMVDDYRVYPKVYYWYETAVANAIIRLTKKQTLKVDVDQFISDYQKRHEIEFSDEQKGAIENAASSSFSIVSGLPGTGKTFVVRALVELAQMVGLSIALCAPTGKAARRLAEVTGVYEASTIHRMLDYHPADGWRVNADNPLGADLVIVDESSMMDIELAYRLLTALDETSVIFVGDYAQLPSVGPGNVLSDIIKSKQVPVVKLEKIFRQAEKSRIVTNAHKLHRGQMLDLSPADDFEFIEANTPEECFEGVMEAYERNRAFFPEVQIISPIYKGASGVDGFNAAAQASANPPSGMKREYKVGKERIFREGDRVIQCKNNYDLGIVNGEIGYIESLDNKNDINKVNFTGNTCEMSNNDLKDMKLAYAMTVHKSQGSEYDCVIVPVTTAHFIMLSRNLFYTAFTRPKSKIVVVGNKKALGIAINNQKVNARNTYLAERLSA